MLYSLLLFLHNITRWLVLIAAVWAVVWMYRGWFQRTAWTARSLSASRLFTIALDVQFLFGLVLYGISPLTQAAMSDFGGAMANSDLRFFAVEHSVMMLIAVILAHVGSALARRSADDAAKHRIAAILYTVSLLIIIVAIPWWRPWLRGI